MRKYWCCSFPLTLLVMMISCSERWVSAQDCPLGLLGPNCTFPCHCLNGDDVCKKGGCDDLQCDFGWTAAPMCQTRCLANKYGLNCFFHCHCPVNDQCNNKNGNCPSQRCHPEWYGPGCQERLARLFNPPTVNVHGCQNVSVSWEAWTYNVDVGVTSISAYILKMRRQGSQKWKDVATMNDDGSDFTVDVPGLEKNGVYQFRVDILSKNEKTNITGPPGVPTAFFLVSCIKSNVIRAVTTQTNGELLLLLADKSNGKVTYTETEIGDCRKINGTTAMESFTNVENLALTTLPWRRYLVTVEIFHPYNIKYIQSILTAETVPTGNVTDIRIERTTSYSASLRWTGLDCSERGGVLLRYDVIITPSNDSSVPTLKKNTTSEMITIKDLEAFTIYRVQVAFVNNQGRGNMTDGVEFQTNESVPDPPQIAKIEPSMYTLNIIWKATENPRGQIQSYHVVCSEDENFDQSISIINSVPKSTNTIFSNLKPFTDYYIKIRASTRSGWGPYSKYKKITTKEGPPSAPKKIERVHGNMTCLTLAWSPPDVPNGILRNYEVTRTEVFSYAKSHQATTVDKITIDNITKYEVCGLLPATQYEFNIKAATAGGQGGSSEPVTFWTEIMSPAAPPPPTIVNISYTSVAITLQPVLTYTGPVSWYEVRVKVLNSEDGAFPKERKKRETRETSFELGESDITAVFTPKTIGYSMVFTIGDNKTYGGFRNKPLTNRNTYCIYYVVYSSLNNASKWNASSTESPLHLLTETEKQGNTTVVLVVVLVVVVLVLLIVLLLVLFYKYRWNRKRHYTAQTNKSFELGDDDALEKHWNATYSNQERRFILVNIDFLPTKPSSPLYSTRPNETFNFSSKQRPPWKQQAKLASHSERNIDGCPITFRKEFDALNELPKPIYTFNEATKIENTKLNRFSHLLPYDHSRVRLKPDSSSPNTYINASLITKTIYLNSNNDINRLPRTYIAAQSPFNTETMRDFWRMIYQQEVRVVVMLTKNVEDKIIKCSEYFPKIVGQSFTFEQFVMRVVNVDNYVDFSITEILLELVGGKQMNLNVFKLFHWPDKRVVGYSLPLLDMRRKVRQFSAKFPHNPVLVHCGTGNGRTGTFITIDILLDEYNQHCDVSVFNHVKLMRERRPHMVRTFTQYLLIYDAIFEGFQAGDLSIFTLSDLDVKYKQLETVNWKTSRTFLEDQFSLLCFLTPKPSISQIRTGLLPENSGKHRYPDIIPPDEFRPQLTNSSHKSSTDPGPPMYINAVFIDGYKRKNAYIVTQTPLPNSLEEFWWLIYEYDVRTIVMMDTNTKGDTCISYWRHPRAFKYFTVTPEGKFVNDRTMVHRLVLRRNDDTAGKALREIHLFRFKCWKSPHFVPVGRDHMLDLIVDVDEWQKKSKRRPIVVHCKDGATNSGLFCTSDLLVRKMTNEMCADVYHTVKKVKIRRPELIPNVEQYKFCHSVIQLHVSRQKL